MSFHLSISSIFHYSVESPQQITGSLQSLHIDAAVNQTFIPDYSVRAVSDVFYVAIKRNLYLAAKRATLMERSKKLGGDLGSNEPIDLEVEKVIRKLANIADIFFNGFFSGILILSLFVVCSFFGHSMKTIEV